jgi:hypothetical protein
MSPSDLEPDILPSEEEPLVECPVAGPPIDWEENLPHWPSRVAITNIPRQGTNIEELSSQQLFLEF